MNGGCQGSARPCTTFVDQLCHSRATPGSRPSSPGAMVYPALTSAEEDSAMQSTSQPRATPPVAAFRRELLQNLHDRVGTDLTFATPTEGYLALAYTVRDRLIQRWLDTVHAGIDSQSRFVCYLSAEY